MPGFLQKHLKTRINSITGSKMFPRHPSILYISDYWRNPLPTNASQVPMSGLHLAKTTTGEEMLFFWNLKSFRDNGHYIPSCNMSCILVVYHNQSQTPVDLWNHLLPIPFICKETFWLLGGKQWKKIIQLQMWSLWMRYRDNKVVLVPNPSLLLSCRFQL